MPTPATTASAKPATGVPSRSAAERRDHGPRPPRAKRQHGRAQRRGRRGHSLDIGTVGRCTTRPARSSPPSAAGRRRRPVREPERRAAGLCLPRARGVAHNVPSTARSSTPRHERARSNRTRRVSSVGAAVPGAIRVRAIAGGGKYRISGTTSPPQRIRAVRLTRILAMPCLSRPTAVGVSTGAASRTPAGARPPDTASAAPRRSTASGAVRSIWGTVTRRGSAPWPAAIPASGAPIRGRSGAAGRGSSSPPHPAKISRATRTARAMPTMLGTTSSARK